MMKTKVLTTFVSLVLCAIPEATADTISSSPVPKVINSPALSLAKKECSSTNLASKLFSEYEDNKHKMAEVINEIVKEENIWSEGLKKILEGEIVRNQKSQKSAAYTPAQERDGVANFINFLTTGDVKAFISSYDDQMDTAVLLMEMIGDICRDRKLIHCQTQDLLSEMFQNLMNKIESLFTKFVGNKLSVDDDTHEKLTFRYRLLPSIFAKIQNTCNQMMSNLNNTVETPRSSDEAYQAICGNIAYFNSLQQFKDDFISSVLDILNTVTNINGLTDVEKVSLRIFDEIMGCARIVDSILDFVISFKDLKEQALGLGLPSQTNYFTFLSYYSTRKVSSALAALALDLYVYSIDDHRAYFRYVDQFLCSSNIRWWARSIGSRIPLQQLGDLNKDELKGWSRRIKRQISDALSKIEGNSATDDDFTLVSTNIKYLETILELGFIVETEEEKDLRDSLYLDEARLLKGLENRRLSWKNTPEHAAALFPERGSGPEWSRNDNMPSAPNFEDVSEHPTINMPSNPSDLQLLGNLYPLLSGNEDEQFSYGDIQHPPSYAEATGLINDTCLDPPPPYDEIVESTMKNIDEDSISTNVELSEKDDDYETTTDKNEGQEEDELLETSKDSLLPQVDKKLPDDSFFDAEDFVGEEQKIIFGSANNIVGSPESETETDLSEIMTDKDVSKSPSFFDSYLTLVKPILAIVFVLVLAKVFYDFY